MKLAPFGEKVFLVTGLLNPKSSESHSPKNFGNFVYKSDDLMLVGLSLSYNAFFFSGIYIHRAPNVWRL